MRAASVNLMLSNLFFLAFFRTDDSFSTAKAETNSAKDFVSMKMLLLLL